MKITEIELLDAQTMAIIQDTKIRAIFVKVGRFLFHGKHFGTILIFSSYE